MGGASAVAACRKGSSDGPPPTLRRVSPGSLPAEASGSWWAPWSSKPLRRASPAWRVRFPSASATREDAVQGCGPATREVGANDPDFYHLSTSKARSLRPASLRDARRV